jgi:hypothetical protein
VAIEIKSRFAALARCLDLTGPPPRFGLTDQVVPVAVLCQNFEFPTLVLRATGTASNGLVTSGRLLAGTYLYSWVWTATIVTATALVSGFSIDSPTAQPRLVLLNLRYGLAGGWYSQSGQGVVNINDQEIVSVAAGATGVSNEAELMVVLQPT